MVNAEERLMRDLTELIKHPLPGIAAKPINDNNLLEWKALISGPPQSPFENGTFSLDISFTHKYPFQPPSVRFTEEIFHPNVYKDGKICLDILQSKWAPTYDVSKILLCIQTLLDHPNPHSPANCVAAQMFFQDKAEYDKHVRQMIDTKIEKLAAQNQTETKNDKNGKCKQQPSSKTTQNTSG